MTSCLKLRVALPHENNWKLTSATAETAESLLSNLHTTVHEYAALRLAEVVLQMGIERYREKSQGTVLQRASWIFAELTLRSFAGLRVDYDDNGEPILVGIRPG